MSFRRRQRSRNHLAAHDGGEAHAPPLVHPLVPAGEADLVNDDASLRGLLEHLRSQKAFAFDTEFIGEITYFPKTCLIQLATTERVALVDPLAITDLAPIWELVASAENETIVHAGASDLSPVRRHVGRAPEGLIDVQVAAAFFGMPYPSSLAKLVDRFAGHTLAKGHTFTDWDARPLSASQLRYAADDVRYLPLLWEAMRVELEARGRLTWVQRETLARLDDPHVFDARAQMRRASRGYDLDPAQEKLLEALCVTRDAIARNEDLPHRATVPDGSLLEIVRSRPDTAAALDAVRGLPHPIVARHGDKFLKTIAANPSPRTDWFRVRRRREDEPTARARIDAMLAEAHASCEELGIAPSLGVTRNDLEAHLRRAFEAASRGASAPPLFAPEDWRSEAFGERIERAAEHPPVRAAAVEGDAITPAAEPEE